MSRHSEMVTAGEVSIERYVDGNGPDVVVLPSYGRDGGDDPPLSDAPLNESDGVLGPRAEPRRGGARAEDAGGARGRGPMTPHRRTHFPSRSR